MSFSELPWLRIFASIAAGLIVIFEVWYFTRKKMDKKWKKVKKPAIVILSMAVIILSVWDTVNEKSNNIKEEERRDTQIVRDSLRAVKISESLQKSIVKADSLKLTVDSISGKADNQLKQLESSSKKLNNIITIQELNNKKLTGGDDFAYIHPMINNNDITKSFFTLHRSGENAIINLEMVTYLDKGKEIHEPIGYLYYSVSEKFDYADFDNSLPESISYSALSGSWDQNIIYQEVNGILEFSYYIISGGSKHLKGSNYILKRFVSEKFPEEKLNKQYEKIWTKQELSNKN